MIWSVVAEADIFAVGQSAADCDCSSRSSNPYDYLRCGYFLDDASLFGGKNFVDFNSDISGNRPGYHSYISGVGKRSFRNLS